MTRKKAMFLFDRFYLQKISAMWSWASLITKGMSPAPQILSSCCRLFGHFVVLCKTNRRQTSKFPRCLQYKTSEIVWSCHSPVLDTSRIFKCCNIAIKKWQFLHIWLAHVWQNQGRKLLTLPKYYQYCWIALQQRLCAFTIKYQWKEEEFPIPRGEWK